jgi:hypothetical protein
MKSFLFLIVAFFVTVTTVFGQCSANINVYNEPSCIGTCDGWAYVEATGTPPFTYQWNSDAYNQTTDTAWYLCGNGAKMFYEVTITDDLGCSATANINLVGSPYLDLAEDSVHATTCTNTCDGIIYTTPWGGTPPYTINWPEAGQSTYTISNLCPGNYSFILTDAKGCTRTGSQSVWVGGSTVIGISNLNEPSCQASNGVLDIYANSTNGGISSYQWSNSATTEDIGGIPAGIYIVTVTDIAGCTEVQYFAVSNVSGPTLTYGGGSSPSCHGLSDGSIIIHANGGNPPYTYNWSSGSASDTATGLDTGMYMVTVTALNGCKATYFLYLNEPGPLTFGLSIDQPSCYGSNTGSIYPGVSGGTQIPMMPYYNFFWSPGGETTEYLSGITSGTYSLTITDFNGCSLDTTVVVGQPAPLNPNTTVNEISCYGDINGGLKFNTTGGYPLYQYSLDSSYWTATNFFANLSPGFYHYYVHDTHYCSFSDTLTLIEPDPLQISGTTTNPTCLAFDGQFDISVLGGTTPYTFSWNTGQTTEDLVNVQENYYEVYVLDAHGCTESYNDWLTQTSWPANISGDAHYSGGPLADNNAVAELYLQTFTGSAWEFVKTIETPVGSGNGNYFFNDVLPGSYCIRIRIDSTQYYPDLLDTYYDSTVAWTNAHIFNIGCDDVITQPIAMYEYSNTAGLGSISGYIILINSKQSKSLGEPVPGAEVYIEQEPNDEPIANGTTDTTGYYHIGNIPVGDFYYLLVDIPGMPQLSTWDSISITPADTVHDDMNFIVDTSSGGGIIADSTLSHINHPAGGLTSVSVFPNPVSDDLNISFTLSKDINVNLEIFNIEGNKVTGLVSNRQTSGVYRYKVNPAKLGMKPGTYFVRIVAGNDIYLKKIIVL